MRAAERTEASARHFGFGRADEHPYRRLVGDAVRVVLALVLLLISARHTATSVERDLARLLADLPAGFRSFFRSVLAVGTIWGVALVTIAALVLRRVRLAIALAGAGILAWLVARLTGFLVARDGLGDAVDAVLHAARLGRYPVVHLAVIGAVVLAAGPFLSRPLRRTGTTLLVLLALGAVTREIGTPNAVFAALVIAWGSAAAMRLAVGSPAGRPTPRQVAGALAELGVAADDVTLAPVQDRGSTRMLAHTADGDLPVRVYGRDAAESRLAAKVWRFVAYKDSGPTLTLTRLQQVEHEALCLLRAKDAGAPVPDLVAVGLAGPSAAVLVTGGGGLTAFAAVDRAPADAVVVDAWTALARLRAARIAHGALDADHLALDGAGALVLTDFSTASIAGSSARLDADVAQLLVTTAALVGARRAVEVAVVAVGSQVVGDARRFLSRPALTPANRRLVRSEKELLGAVTTAVTDATGREPEAPIELRRVKPLNIVMFAAAAFALWVILAQVGSLSELWATLRTAQIPWTVAGFVASTSTAIAFAAVTLGSVPEAIPLLPATLLQMAISFANMVAATSVSSTVMNIRFLQKQGVEVGAATSSGVLAGISGTVAQFTLFAVSALAVGEDIRLGDIGGPGDGDGRLILIVVAIGAVLLGTTLAVPQLRRIIRSKVWPQLVGAFRNLWGILTTPRQLVLVLGGSFTAQLLYVVCLACCLRAYGGSLPFLEVMFVNASASFLANLTPVPGGMGIQEAALIAGLGAFGVAPDVATAAVVTHRLFTTYLPPIWGSWATKKLLADGYL